MHVDDVQDLANGGSPFVRREVLDENRDSGFNGIGGGPDSRVTPDSDEPGDELWYVRACGGRRVSDRRKLSNPLGLMPMSRATCLSEETSTWRDKSAPRGVPGGRCRHAVLAAAGAGVSTPAAPNVRARRKAVYSGFRLGRHVTSQRGRWLRTGLPPWIASSTRAALR